MGSIEEYERLGHGLCRVISQSIVKKKQTMVVSAFFVAGTWDHMNFIPDWKTKLKQTHTQFSLFGYLQGLSQSGIYQDRWNPPTHPSFYSFTLTVSQLQTLSLFTYTTHISTWVEYCGFIVQLSNPQKHFLRKDTEALLIISILTLISTNLPTDSKKR